MKKSFITTVGANDTTTTTTTTKTLKFQLVKEENHLTGNIYYWTTDENDSLISNSMSCDLNEAKRIFNVICENHGLTTSKTIVETYEA